MTDPNQTLSALIDQFIADAGLAHDFVKGDETLDVQGAEGTYPSLAKIAKQARTVIEQIIADQQGLKIRKYDFSSTTELIIEHKQGTTIYDISIRDTEGNVIYAPDEPVDGDTVKVEFADPVEGYAILQLYTAL